MEKITKFFVDYGWVLWVGIWLPIFGIEITDWKWWAFFVPLAFMIAFKSYSDIENGKKQK